MPLLVNDERGVPQAAIARAAAAPPPKAAAKPKSRPAHPALAQAAAKYTGAFSGALNELDAASQRNRDVAARRQADNAKYQAYVLGQQGSIAAAGQAADDKAIQQSGMVQAATAGFTGAIGKGMQSARAAQGIGGGVPLQQLAGPADDATRLQGVLGAGTQQLADRANTNRGKAGFLAAAAQAALLANQRAIAGDEFQNESSIRRDKVDVLNQRTQSKITDRRQAASDAAAAQAAQAAAASDAADRASRESIAAASIGSRENIASANRANARTLANIRAKDAGGKTTAAGRAARVKANAQIRSSIETAAADARYAIGSTTAATGADGKTLYADKDGKVPQTRTRTQKEVRASLRAKYKDNDVANAAMDLAVLGRISPANKARLKRRHITVPKSWLNGTPPDMWG